MEKYWPVSLWPGLQQLLTAPAHSSGLLVPGYSIICVTGYSIITCSPGRGTPPRPRPRPRLPRSRRRPRPRSRGRQRPRSQHWTWEIFSIDFLTRKMIVGVTFTRERPQESFDVMYEAWQTLTVLSWIICIVDVDIFLIHSKWSLM